MLIYRVSCFCKNEQHTPSYEIKTIHERGNTILGSSNTTYGSRLHEWKQNTYFRLVYTFFITGRGGSGPPPYHIWKW